MGTHDCKTKIMTEFYVGGIWTGDWTSVMSDPREFVFSPSTPLYDFRLSIGTAVIYLGVIAVLHWMMKGRPAMSLPWISNVHNLILSVWSLVMHVGILYGVWEKYISQGRPLIDLLCDKDPEPMTGTLAYFCWMYYVSKYYELFDTVLMVVKHKPLTVLHLWHHAVIGPMSLSWLRGNWMLHWYGAAVNTLIHVFMYFYYFAVKAYGYRPWWRVHITQGQIAQFFSVFFLIWVFVYKYIQSPPVFGPVPDGAFLPTVHFDKGCTGDFWTIAFAQFVNITFLVLFINFYIQTYKKAKAKSKSSKSKSQ